MTYAEFEASLHDENPPAGLSLALQGLWHEARGDWNRAHECAQEQEDRAGCWVHAYLHRQEGDQPNAAYWYRRAGQPVADGPLDQEWRSIAQTLLADE